MFDGRVLDAGQTFDLRSAASPETWRVLSSSLTCQAILLGHRTRQLGVNRVILAHHLPMKVVCPSNAKDWTADLEEDILLCAKPP